MAAKLVDFMSVLFGQAGKPYIYGFEVQPNEEDPAAFDCSELFEWASAQVAAVPPLVDGTWLQVQQLRDLNLLIPVSAGLKTWGALLFKFDSSPFGLARPKNAHVAVSLGDGRTFEARSPDLGIGAFDGAASRGWTHAGLVPGLNYPDGIPRWTPTPETPTPKSPIVPKPSASPSESSPMLLYVGLGALAYFAFRKGQP